MSEETPLAALSTPAPAPQQPEITKHDNFESWYANHIQYEPSEWDLRMVFGILDLPPGKPVSIQQHTAMSLSWRHAKVMAYFLNLHLAIFEKLNGKIKVPESVWPPEPIAPSEELKATNPTAQDFYEVIKQARDQWVSEQVSATLR